MAKGIIGVISDTHGLVRPEVLEALKGSDLIIHAGDIGGSRVLDALRTIAPVKAVRGNMDGGELAGYLPKTEVVEFGSSLIYVIHDLGDLDLDPATAGFSAVVCGHSHRPFIRERNGVLLLNPGSAGPRRFDLPVSFARLSVSNGTIEPLLVELNVPAPKQTA